MLHCLYKGIGHFDYPLEKNGHRVDIVELLITSDIKGGGGGGVGLDTTIRDGKLDIM